MVCPLYYSKEGCVLCNEFMDATQRMNYYLQHQDNSHLMETIRWKDPDFYRQIQRINYIQDITAKTSSKCPECDTILTQEVSWEIYCPKCGLVVSSNINYVAGIQIDFPYGLRL